MHLASHSVTMKTLKTKRLVLRQYAPSDYAAWVASSRSRKPGSTTRARFLRMLKALDEMAKRDEAYRWMVFAKKTGEVLGWVDVYVFMRDNVQAANFGYGLHSQHWGQGYGREAAHAVAVAAFRDLKLQRLEAAILPTNRPSINLIRALGFKKEGIRRNGHWHEGEWRDTVVYAATPREFGLPMKAPKIGLL